MLTKAQAKRFRALRSAIRKLERLKKRTAQQDRELADRCRDALRLYQDAATKGIRAAKKSTKTFTQLKELAHDAMRYLGGEAERSSASLKDYDSDTYGPYLGISDEGSAAAIIRQAALDSPKTRALKLTDPMKIGVAHDAERLASIGEVPVGPDEYVNIRLECTGRILTSTNVGTRLNLRFYKRHPVVDVLASPQSDALAAAKLAVTMAFKPFLKDPVKDSRPLCVFIRFEPSCPFSDKKRASILRSIVRHAADPAVASKAHHSIGYQAPIGSGFKGQAEAMAAVDMARRAGIQEVALEGTVRRSADEFISMPGMLNYLAPGLLGPLLRYANERDINIRPVNTVDPDTVARNIWSSLHTARQMGLALGKYGVFPLTLEECDAVVGPVQAWFTDWTAAPVFFVDQGLVSKTRVDTHGDIIRGLKDWLRMVGKRGHKVPAVLIDTVDKSKGWRLLKTAGDPKGLIGPRQLEDIIQLADRHGIKVLWAGGINQAQAFEFGKLGVFGIYVTSAASAKKPVSAEYENDPLLPMMKEPSYEGVFRTKLLLESGFLCRRISDGAVARQLEAASHELLELIDQKVDTKQIARAEAALVKLTTGAWTMPRKTARSAKPKKTSPTPPSLTKSRYMSGLQCTKRLYLEARSPGIGVVSASTQATFDRGAKVGLEARNVVPHGTAIDGSRGRTQAKWATDKAIAAQVPAIYEAALGTDGLDVRVDILEGEPSIPAWNIVEVKSSTGLKDYHVDDIAIQVVAAQQQGVPLNDYGLLHLNKNYTRGPGGLNSEQLFQYKSVHAELTKSRFTAVRRNVKKFQKILQGDNEPCVTPGAHCSSPHSCPFIDYCVPPPHPLALEHLPGHSAIVKKLGVKPVKLVTELPKNLKLSTQQRRAVQAMLTGGEVMGDNLRKNLEDVRYPIHFLDFETVAPAIPRYEGTRPYQALPCQWSNHILHKDGSMAHEEFLHDADTDPREAFIISLLAGVKGPGTICVYSSYERTQLRALATAFPRYAKRIDKVIDRLWDLLKVVRDNYYHPEFHGSFSIKYVLPAITEISYQDLDIGDGQTAALQYEEMIKLPKSSPKRKKIRADLLKYCALDTYAMFAVRQSLLDRCSAPNGVSAQ